MTADKLKFQKMIYHFNESEKKLSKGYSIIYLRIKEIADMKHMSIQYIEQKCNLSNGTIGKWKTKVPQSDNLAKVARFLNTTIDYLVGKED